LAGTVQFGGKVQCDVHRSALVFGKIGDDEKSLAIGGDPSSNGY
jgi:hypothetical protein